VKDDLCFQRNGERRTVNNLSLRTAQLSLDHKSFEKCPARGFLTSPAILHFPPDFWDRNSAGIGLHVIPGILMDSLDLEILTLIQNDARVAHASVGERLGLTAPAVHARIKRLERDGIIRGYLTSIDPLAVNQTLLAFIRVMNNAAGQDEQFFEEFVRGEPSILECHDISGEDSYMLKIRTDSPTSLRSLLSKIREFPGVVRTITSISLCTIKESGGPPLPARSQEAINSK
jgi:Lrp/AsnC family transcriptional regulator, leucine-responsive regulatory protein